VVRIFICPVQPLNLWPLNLKICSRHLLSVMYMSTKFEVCQAKGSQDIEWSVYSYIQFDPLTFDFLTIKSIMVIYFSWCTSLQSLKSVKQRVLKILSGQYTLMSSLTPWPFDFFTSKSIGVIYFLWCTSLQSCLKSVKQRVLKILSGQYIHVQFDPLTFDLFSSINRGHLLFRMYQCF
jgi:hypothetical protein